MERTAAGQWESSSSREGGLRTVVRELVRRVGKCGREDMIGGKGTHGS